MASTVPLSHRASPTPPYRHTSSASMFRAHKSPTRQPTAAGSFTRPKGGGMPRRYETVYIFDSALEEPQVNEKLERFHALITKDSKGTVGNVAHWGKRTLTYRLKKKDTGYYVVVQFETEPALLPEYERALKLDESLLRFLTVVNEGEPPKPVEAPVIAALEEEL